MGSNHYSSVSSSAWLGKARQGGAGRGLAWSGMVGSGKARRGLVGHGKVRRGPQWGKKELTMNFRVR
jgi:hypothetical protein